MLARLPGVDKVAGYKQKIVQWCFDAISPPLPVEVSNPIPASAGTKVLYVIYVAESDLGPHFLNGRKGAWIRTDEFSQRYKPELATDNEIRRLLDRRREIRERRKEILRRSRRRLEVLLEQVRTSDEKTALLEFSIGPRFPTHPTCEQAQLVRVSNDTRIRWRQVDFPLFSSDQVSQHESILFLASADARNRASLVEANIWGMLFYATELQVELAELQKGQETPIRGIHLYWLVGYLLAFSEHSRLLLPRLGYQGPISIIVSLRKIRGIPFLYVSEQSFSGIDTGPVSRLDDEFSFTLETTTEELKERRDALVVSMLQFILFGMNWATYASDSVRLQRLLNQGYRYNFWQH